MGGAGFAVPLAESEEEEWGVIVPPLLARGCYYALGGRSDGRGWRHGLRPRVGGTLWGGGVGVGGWQGRLTLESTGVCFYVAGVCPGLGVLGCGGCVVSMRVAVARCSAGGSHAGGGGESRRCVQPDTEVACRVRDGTGAWTWILGTVLRYAADTKKYEVLDAGEVDDDDDEDEEDGGGGGGGAAGGEKRRSGHAPQSKYVWLLWAVVCGAPAGGGGEGDVLDGWASSSLPSPVVAAAAGGVVERGAPAERSARAAAWRGCVPDAPVVVGGVAVQRSRHVLGAAVDGCALAGTFPSVLFCRLGETSLFSVL